MPNLLLGKDTKLGSFCPSTGASEKAVDGLVQLSTVVIHCIVKPLCLALSEMFQGNLFALSGLIKKAERLLRDSLNFEDVSLSLSLSLSQLSSWCYVRACSCTDLGRKTLLANPEFLLLIMARAPIRRG